MDSQRPGRVIRPQQQTDLAVRSSVRSGSMWPAQSGADVLGFRLQMPEEERE